MASQTGCEINSEVAGSILTVFPVKKKKEFSHVSRTCTTQPLKKNDESNTTIASHSNTEKVGGKIGYWLSHRGSSNSSYLSALNSYPNLGNMSGLVGENVVGKRV